VQLAQWHWCLLPQAASTLFAGAPCMDRPSQWELNVGSLDTTGSCLQGAGSNTLKACGQAWMAAVLQYSRSWHCLASSAMMGCGACAHVGKLQHQHCSGYEAEELGLHSSTHPCTVVASSAMPITRANTTRKTLHFMFVAGSTPQTTRRLRPTDSSCCYTYVKFICKVLELAVNWGCRKCRYGS
jgi:hypothetical protein